MKICFQIYIVDDENAFKAAWANSYPGLVILDPVRISEAGSDLEGMP